MAPRKSQTQANYVYFVQAKTMRLIKIGIAACYNSRLSNLQTGSPDILELLGLIRHDEPKQLEARLHVEFGDHRAHGEWFNPAPRLLAYIAKHAISRHQDQYELAHQAISKLGGLCEPCPPWTPELAAIYEQGDTAFPAPAVYAEPRRPAIPEGVSVPAGNSRAARMERYRLARGLAA